MPIMKPEEHTKDLVERARKGDRSAFDELAQTNRPRLEALVRSRLGPELRTQVSVEDILQETFLQAFGSLERFEWQGEHSLLRWLGGIAENVMRKEHRGHQLRQKVRLEPRQPEQVSPSKEMQREERFERLECALEHLSDDYRQVIVLARIEQLKIREIAAKMNRSETAVRNLLMRALKELQRHFGDTESLRLPPRNISGRTGS